MKRSLQYRLMTLMIATAVAAITFAVFYVPSSLERQLRRDLGIPPDATLSIIDRSKPFRTIAIKCVDSTFTIFVAFNDGADQGAHGWSIPVVAGSGAPPDMPEYDFEYSREFDHSPTELQIAEFHDEFGLI